MEINKQDIEKEREIIKELQRQLAEKDKEIEYLEALVKAYEDLYNETHSRFIKALNALKESLDDTK